MFCDLLLSAKLHLLLQFLPNIFDRGTRYTWHISVFKCLFYAVLSQGDLTLCCCLIATFSKLMTRVILI